MKKEHKLVVKSISLKTLLFAVLFLLSFGIFTVLAHEVVGEHEEWFDTKIFTYLQAHSTPAIIKFFKTLTFLGSTLFLLSAYIFLEIYLLIKRRKEEAINVAIIALTGNLLLFSLKAFFARHRPEKPLFDTLNNYSFPSGHALSSFIFCCILILLVRKTHWKESLKYLVSILLIIISLLIGISRVVLRYHYATDVIAGFCLGFSWVILSFYLLRKLKIDMTNYKRPISK